MTIHINKNTLAKIKIVNLNHFDLRGDLENNNIYDTKLVAQGYVGNRPNYFEGDFHEDDTWAIDCYTSDGMEVTSYLYVSEKEYKEDLEILTLP